MKTLNLTLNKKWFDMIASGEKKEEYREIKEYWSTRLIISGREPINCINSLKDKIELRNSLFGDSRDLFKEYTHIQFKNGYSKNAPTMLVECLGITYGNARPEWSDNWQGDVYILKLGKIITQS